MNELRHHGILGQKWGIRRYQNEDGSLTEAGRKRMEKKDNRWADRNYNRIYNKAYKKSAKELNKYAKKVLNKEYANKGKNYINAYNQKMAEIMNTHVSEYKSPSGKEVKFVAKRGDWGVHMALADPGYNMNNLKNGVWTDGRVAYKKDTVDMS